MSDLAKWNVHGPVRLLRTEFAEWDLTVEEWQAARQSTLIRFRPDGQIDATEHHNPDGSTSETAFLYDAAGRLTESRFQFNGAPSGISTCHYDEAGRLSRITAIESGGPERIIESWTYDVDGNGTKTYFVPELPPNTGFSVCIDGTDGSYSAEGAQSIATFYGPGGPVEAIMRDAKGRSVRRVVFHRDAAGRKTREELRDDASLPAVIAPEGIFSSTTYAYDAVGHLIERRTLFGPVGDNRTTWRYDDRGNRVEETNEDISREAEIDNEGNVKTLKERSHRHHTRFEYVYDEHSNWTERIVWGRLEPNPNFQRSNIERRVLEYY